MTNGLAKLKARLLQGIKAKCVDGRWSADDLPLPNTLLVVGTTRGLQCWKDGELLDELDERDGPLSDPDELSTKIPQEEWELGLNGKPKPPWALVYVVYLVDPESAELYTFINSTYGARLAYERLTRKLEMMARLRGAGVTALVKPDSRQMKTKEVGLKLRPEFTILEWRDIGGGEDKHAADCRLRPTKIRLAQPRSRRRKRSRRHWQAGEAGYAARRTRRHLAFLTAARCRISEKMRHREAISSNKTTSPACHASHLLGHRNALDARARDRRRMALCRRSDRPKCCASASRSMTPSRKSGHRDNRSRKPSSRPPPIRAG